MNNLAINIYNKFSGKEAQSQTACSYTRHTANMAA